MPSLALTPEGFPNQSGTQTGLSSVASEALLVSQLVSQHRAVVCAAPSYLEARGEPETLEELAAHDCLIFNSRTRRQGWLLRQKGGSWVIAAAKWARLRFFSSVWLLGKDLWRDGRPH
ncbi:hypothetical protein DAT35_44550 [Vitiosangium sp. GDMCC 1.1324]|nr:hypothetical protein DAT35_44550 [Vitiosangium sp. GDMCC 1.1324]